MTLTVRPFDPPRDAATVAQMFTWHDEFEWKEQDVLNNVARFPAESPMLRLIVEEGGETVAFGRVCQVTPNPRGSFPAEVIVWPQHQRRGIGRRLFERLEEYAAGHGAGCVTVLAHERLPGSIQALERLGYTARTNYYQSFHDPRGFDAAQFANEIERVASAGYELQPLSALPEGEESDRAYYEAVHESDQDTPFMDYFGWPSFEDYRKMTMDSGWFHRDNAFVATKHGAIVGVTTVNRGSGDFNGQMFIDYTGVVRAHRGRGIATALKVRALERAKALGATMVRTENNTDNPAMRAVNKKLGFVEKPGMWLMTKEALSV